MKNRIKKCKIYQKAVKYSAILMSCSFIVSVFFVMNDGFTGGLITLCISTMSFVSFIVFTYIEEKNMKPKPERTDAYDPEAKQ